MHPQPLAIERQRQRDPGSELVIEQELGSQGNYQEYVASYQSDGLTIYGLLTVPTGDTPAGGWPIIIFNHGYIRPEDYQTTQRYEAYQAYFARNGYITFKSDYRGHGQSEGDPEGGYYSPAYTTDVLNAKASVQRLPEANPDEVGRGHSMGGYITLRSMVIADDIDAGVIWGGVVGSYEEIYQAWQRRRSHGHLRQKKHEPASKPAPVHKPWWLSMVNQIWMPSSGGRSTPPPIWATSADRFNSIMVKPMPVWTGRSLKLWLTV